MSKHDYQIIVAVDEETYNKTPARYRLCPPAPREMSAREYVNARRRLCNAHLNAVTQCIDDFVTRCAGCLIEDYCEGAKDDVDEEIAIVEKWAREHPEKRKTYAEDFFEKFPNGVKFKGKPWLCRRAAYGGNCKRGFQDLIGSCDDCWNEEMEEQDG